MSGFPTSEFFCPILGSTLYFVLTGSPLKLEMLDRLVRRLHNGWLPRAGWILWGSKLSKSSLIPRDLWWTFTRQAELLSTREEQDTRLCLVGRPNVVFATFVFRCAPSENLLLRDKLELPPSWQDEDVLLVAAFKWLGLFECPLPFSGSSLIMPNSFFPMPLAKFSG